MIESGKPTVAIVDFGMGNLFSVKNACEMVGLNAIITSEKSVLMGADSMILPGVGAFADAMASLIRLDLVALMKDFIGSSKPFFGICIGMQLLMDKSFEFGTHKGMGLISGTTARFENIVDKNEKPLKVPHIGWNRIDMAKSVSTRSTWSHTLLDRLADGEFMYFVHSYYIKPEDTDICLSTTRYGNIEFCSSLQHGNIFATQFHPERSGSKGLKIYSNFASYLQHRRDREVVK